MTRKIYLLTVVLLLSHLSKAQFFNYLKDNVSINTTTGVYSDLGTNGTKITNNFLGQPIGATNDNSSVQNIGFTFNYAGTNYTQFVLNTNGFIKLGNDTTSASASQDVLTSTDPSANNVIYPCNVNLQPTGNTEYRVFTTGTSGSKTCTIQFKAVMDSGCPQCGPTDRQFDYMEFQIVLHEGSNVIDFIFGSFTASVNPAAFIQTNCGLKGVDPAHSVNITKASATAFASATVIEGPYPGNHFNLRNGVLPNPGTTITFTPVPVLANNVAVQTIYHLGKVPKLYDNTFSCYVRNISTATLLNFPVTLDVTGANSKTLNKTLDTIKPGETKLVTFPTLNWTNTGTNTMIVSVPNDDDNSDNRDTVKQDVTNLTIGTVQDTTILGNLGQTTTSIDMGTRFKNPYSNKVTALTAYMAKSGQTFRFYIYGVSGDTPKTKLYSGTNLTSVVGKNTLTLASPITVTGDFFVVVTQLSTTTSVGLGFQPENPIRSKTFYGRSPQGSSVAPTSAWFDFAPNNSFKLMMEATMQTATWPIVLTSFEGFKDGKNNILNWQTSSEINSLGFEIQRSNNGKDFTKIGFVSSRGTSNTIVNYNFVDSKPGTGTNYYRLRQLDKDGKETFSEIVTIKSDDKIKLEVVSLYPNPSKDNVNLVFNSANTNKTNITITSLNGKVVLSQTLNPNKGENKIQLNTGQLPAGNYLINISEMDTENSVNTKYIKL